jgi:hypothetical protein
MPSSKSLRTTGATNSLQSNTVNEDTYLLFVSVAYTSNATVGNRQIVLQVLDPSNNVLAQHSAGLVQAASLVNRYNFMPCITRETALVNSEVNVPIPFDLMIPSGGSFKVLDTAGIAAGDSMVVGYGLLSTRT